MHLDSDVFASAYLEVEAVSPAEGKAWAGPSSTCHSSKRTRDIEKIEFDTSYMVYVQQ